jgi:AraC-like DNA-binding protein
MPCAADAMSMQATPDTRSGDAARAELLRLIEALTARAGTVETVVPGLSLSWMTSPIAPAGRLYGPSLCVCLRGAKQISLGSQHLAHPADHFLLTTLQMPIVVSVAAASSETPYVGLQVDLDLERAREVIADVELHRIETPTADPCIAIGVLTEPLFDAVLRLVRLTQSPRDIPVLSDLIQREILYRLASGPKGNRLRRIVRLRSSGHAVTKLLAWLREHYTEKLRIEQLSEQAGMGVSTLHRHFLELTTMSPIQYQKHLRLHEARRLLLVEEVDATTAAIHVGYESVSQFNREYRRLFGEPPRRDVNGLKRLVYAEDSIS